jgi:glucosamine-6-phosphate deaminase
MPNIKTLYDWCSIPADQLAGHPSIRIPFRMVEDSALLGEVMAEELASVVRENNQHGRPTRAIVPCGPRSWYAPFTRTVNTEQISLKELTVFHMDECLDWQGRLLPKRHPYNFRSFMEEHFYGGIASELAVPETKRIWLTPENIRNVEEAVDESAIDITLGGWGQDGHVAYNQARRQAYSSVDLETLRESSIRIQENNTDTLIALGHRSFGSAWQFVPPMSVTLGLRQCLAAKKVRLFSDTGSWKQTALRVALFSAPDPDYPMTLLQYHEDAILTATRDTATHPISENPDWDFFGESGFWPAS